MNVAVQILAGVAAALHVAFFVLESVLFTRPQVSRLFGARSREEVDHQRLFAFNQGFYNLFLAIGCVVGLVLVDRPTTAAAGEAIVVYALAFMLAASVVLVVSERRMVQAATVQGGPPLLALVLHLAVG